MVSSYLQPLENHDADGLDQAAMEHLDFAVDGADRMRAMITGLLRDSRVTTQGDPLDTVDLNAVLADARDDLRVKVDESDADITVEDLSHVRVEGNQLRQVFEPPRERDRLQRRRAPRIHVGATRRDAADEGGRDGSTVVTDSTEWLLWVEDHGSGIDPAHAEGIFDVFERLHTHDEHSGTGIGLALCERIVERQAGTFGSTQNPARARRFISPSRASKVVVTSPPGSHARAPRAGTDEGTFAGRSR